MNEQTDMGGDRFFDFGLTKPGDVVKVVSGNSSWYFTKTVQAKVTQYMVTGVFVTTNIHAGVPKSNPSNTFVDRHFFVPGDIGIGRNGHTGIVREIWLNGVRQL